MTWQEYLFLLDKFRGDASYAFADVGIQCYENGWIDDFGIVTPKGQTAMENYESSNKA